MQENAMPTSEALPVEGKISAHRDSVDQAIRSLVGLTDRPKVVKAAPADSARLEEVLIDTEVDGSRYLLVRIPGPAATRIQLSPREQEIVRMVARGHPNKVIADVLNISSWTVSTHLRRIFAKLGVCSRAAMVARIAELGMVAPSLSTRAMAD
jgi:DNA-binding NarL/FixJ family response regulator